ncbi:MAG: hypothetical protein J6Q82_02045 [Clostridia bacterium]|nr:hypothetical protein [Clostridia bacterium]
MMKKFIALSLSLLMLLSVCLTGCSEKTDEEAVEDISKKASKSAMTLSMYLMSEEPVEKCDDCIAHDAGEDVKVCTDQNNAQPCTYRLVSDAVNRVTESKFKTRLVLNYYTEAEYYKKLEESFAAREAAKKAGQLANTVIAEETEEDETFVNELGQIEIKYPTIAGYQVDIFFLGGEAKFNEYRQKNLLASLDNSLSDASKKLNQYIFPQFLSGIKTLGGGTTYAIPNNRTVGEYTFLLLNKQALNDTYRRTEGGSTTFDTYTSLTAKDCERFLDDVHNYQADKFYPIYKDADITNYDIAKATTQFVGVGDEGKIVNEFSLMGWGEKTDTTFGGFSTLEDDTFIETLTALKKYETQGYYYDAATDAGKKFAIGYVKGGAELIDQYSKEYEMIVVEAPTMTAETVLESTFAVCANTTSLLRSMQILTYLNTDEDFRNLILYGIEGEHYRVIDTNEVKNQMGDTYKQAERLNNKYVMDVNKTGNVFISYPSTDKIASIYDWGVKQNQDIVVEMAFGFDLDNTGYQTDREALKMLRTVSADIWAKYEESATIDEFLAYAQAKLEVSAVKSTLIQQIKPHAEPCGDPLCPSFACAFATVVLTTEETK